MHHSDWLEASPILLTERQWASLGPEQRRLRAMQNMARVHYLHSQHQGTYGIPAVRLALLDEETETARANHRQPWTRA